MLQYDRTMLSIYDLEDRYCSDVDRSRHVHEPCCNPNNRGDCLANICLLTHEVNLSGSQSPTPGTCCYLFISDSFDANDRTSLAYDLHEMFHIFQISNYVGTKAGSTTTPSTSQEDQRR